MRERWVAIADLAAELNRVEKEAGLPTTRRARLRVRRPSPTGGPRASDLETLLADHEMSGGDFVRNIKQLIDLLRQFALIAPEAATRAAAAEAANRLFRGVVASSSVVAGQWQ